MYELSRNGQWPRVVKVSPRRSMFVTSEIEAHLGVAVHPEIAEPQK
jgi:predicted DNA-binding transcriptional regulator AlpA